ncbi:MAG TPA: permease, partial [Patescibacteria group bacterium]|nr:permease [Patescibacteria group bacterium]
MVYLNELLIVLQLVIYQFRLIFFFWAAGLLLGSIISVYAADSLRRMVLKLNNNKHQVLSLIAAAALGAASPICMYGTVPLIASLGKENMPQQLLVSFMVSSILINPSLFIFSFTLGAPLAIARLLVSIGLGITAGLFVKLFYSKSSFFQLESFKERKRVCSKAKTFKSFLNDLNRAVSITAPYFLIGILLTALFDRYFPQELILDLFSTNKGLGVLL